MSIGYMQKRWTQLTQFLRVPGASLDNNVTERILKMAILHRKNSLFYRTQRGADVGDLFMSLVETCRANQVNPLITCWRWSAMPKPPKPIPAAGCPGTSENPSLRSPTPVDRASQLVAPPPPAPVLPANLAASAGLSAFSGFRTLTEGTRSFGEVVPALPDPIHSPSEHRLP